MLTQQKDSNITVNLSRLLNGLHVTNEHERKPLRWACVCVCVKTPILLGLLFKIQ